MTLGIGKRGLGSRAGLSRRPLASGLKAVPRVVGSVNLTTTGGVSYTVPAGGNLALIWVFGGGAGGMANTGGSAAGGGGGGACFAAVPVNPGQVISASIANSVASTTDGEDTAVSVGARTLLAKGGKTTTNSSIPGAGGAAQGGDVNRRGGDGGIQANAGVAGDFGGTGGNAGASGGAGGGGGCGGFSDTTFGTLLQNLTWGNGGTGGPGTGGLGVAGATPGGAGGGGGNPGNAGGTGAQGRVCIIVLAV